MDKQEILEILKEKETQGLAYIITTENDFSIVIQEGLWKLKNFFGYFLYTSEELTEELLNWNEEIISIE